MTKSQRAQLARHMRRFADAVEEKAFQGTIPAGESIAAAEAYDAIDVELDRARMALVNFVERISK